MFRFSSTLCIIFSLARAVAVPIDGDVFADTWVATDALGRSLPTFQEVGPPRADRHVGLFYFLWVNREVSNRRDLPALNKSEILAKNPNNPKWGPPGSFHFWGEPEMGYYSIEDPFVLTKHRSMLTAAGIDTLLFDQTNTLIYPNQMLAVCENLEHGRRQGLPVPKVAAVHNSRPERSVPKLYDTLYAPGKYQELWFHWLGKPLLLSNPETLSQEMKDYFTIRHTWAWSRAKWFGDGRDKWTWIDWSPQQPGWHESPDKPEQISVCVAPHPIHGKGRSAIGTEATPAPKPDQLRTAEGNYATQQWNRALKIDPPFILVTGWNEWIAQRQTWGEPHKPSQVGHLKIGEGDSYFVDQFNQEFSRDIEPMKGGHSDNYYYQLVANIRRYKGVRPPVVPVTKPIVIDGLFDDWTGVKPEYRDFRGDTIHRDHLGWNKNLRYTDTTGRNDIVSAQVSADTDQVYFRVTCAENITPSDGKAWMRLLIDVDQDPQTGWSGYDLIVNRSSPDASGLSVHSIRDGAMSELARIPYAVTGEQLELALPKRLFGSSPVMKFDFKWGDNQQNDDEVVQFALHGDAAPDRRFNYRYDQSVTEKKIRSLRKAFELKTP